jgi:Tol biopolymer transport system component
MAKRPHVRWKSLGIKEEERLTSGLVHHRAPAWSTDGRWLAMRVGDHEPAWIVVDRRGRVARALPGVADGGASWAPDGALAFGRKVGPGAEIWLASTPASPPVRLLGGDGRIYRHPAFAPDGLHLAFACAESPDAAMHLFILELATGARVAMPHEAGRSDTWPAFAPDGAELFFEATQLDGEVGCFMLGPERRDPVRVSTAAPSRHPAPISADLVVVERPLVEGSQLVLIDRRDGREREFTLDDPRLGDLRDPSVCRSKSGKLKVAFSAVVREDGLLRRYDVCAARFKGVSLDGELDDTAQPEEGAVAS